MLDNVVSVGQSEPCVFGYLDYRVYLTDWHAWRKGKQASFSGALFAKKAKLRAHTLLGMVIRGQRNLSQNTVAAFVRALGLSAKRAVYFEKLVFYTQAKHPDDREIYFQAMVRVASGSRQAAAGLKPLADYSRYLSSWTFIVVRELVQLADFRPDAEWIARKLKGRLTKREAQIAWDTVLELGLVCFDDMLQRYRTDKGALDVDPQKIDFVIRRYHKQVLEQTIRSVEDDTLADRELSSLIIPVSEASLEYVRRSLQEFRRETHLELSSQTKNGTAQYVIALNTQMLVMTTGGDKHADGE